MEITFALTRKPDQTFINAICKSGKKGSYKKAVAQHREVCEAVESLGIQVYDIGMNNPLMRNNPDGVFTEDIGVFLNYQNTFVITRPRMKSRRKERKPLIWYAARQPWEIKEIQHGFIEGGDILIVENKIFVGISERTNKQGFNEFKSIVEPFGYSAFPIQVVNGLHLKTLITYQGKHKDNMNLFFYTPSSEADAVLDCVRRYICFEVVEPEAANAITHNGVTLIPANCPKTAKKLREIGANFRTVDISAFQEKDGSLSCLTIIGKIQVRTF